MKLTTKPFQLNLLRPGRIIGILVFAGIWIFWSFFYKYNLYFQEQLQLFLLTKHYFLSHVIIPGGLAGYLGEFFTQFYIVPFAGGTIITLLLLALQQLTQRLLQTVCPGKNTALISLLPAVWYSMTLTNTFYLLGGLIGVDIALLFMLLYTRFSGSVHRAIAGIVLIPLTYFLTGGSYLLVLFGISMYEIINSHNHRLGILWPILFLAEAVALPLLVKEYYYATPHLQAFISNQYYKISTAIPFPVVLIWLGIPLLMLFVYFAGKREKLLVSWPSQLFEVLVILLVAISGFKLFTDMSSEHIKAFDYFVRRGDWNKIIEKANKDLPRNTFAINYLNLALAKTGQLGDKMFNYTQDGEEGLFMPYNREHLTAMLGNEVFYQLGLVNVSQQYIFESTEATPDLKKTVRAVKRLAETNLINGQYEVARKYLHKLKQTLFYRKWALNAETYLYNDKKIARNPDWGEKRRTRPEEDYFFDIHHIDQILIATLHDHPHDRFAFEYLMAYYLVKKDLKDFMTYLPHAREMGYKELPESYQEAMLYVLGLYSKNPEKDALFPVNPEVQKRLHQYAGIYTTTRNAEKLLKKDFGNTYWYYLHYRKKQD